MQNCLRSVAVLASAIPHLSAAIVSVPGTSDPYLAGMPDGSTASLGDVAPGQSPVLVTGVALSAGNTLRFSASGIVSNGPFGPPSCPDSQPDGDQLASHWGGAENGISELTAPLNSLVGVFLGPDQPDLTAAPAMLDYSDPASRDYLILSPDLKQIFFIGDGVTSLGAQQEIVVPVGATRLFLGTVDGYEWANNVGAFQVTVVPEPAGTALGAALLLGGFCYVRSRFTK